MILDIKNCLMRENVQLEGEYLLDLAEKPVSVELTLRQPVKVSYHCTKNGENGVLLALTIAFTATAQCAMCLKDFEYSFSAAPEFDLIKSDYDCVEPELPFTSDGKLDLDELCYTEILLELPSVILCSDSCQGLCPVCHKPLSEGCGCDPDAGHGRQSIFNQLLS